MKSFDDFKSTLTEADLSSIANKAQDVIDETRDEFAENLKTSTGNQIAVISLFISLGLLERYHEWLHEES